MCFSYVMQRSFAKRVKLPENLPKRDTPGSMAVCGVYRT
jgi:hypothetical protein